MRGTALGLTLSNLVGWRMATRRGERGLPFGVPSPVKGRGEVVVWGTALSAPVPLIAFAAAAAPFAGLPAVRKAFRLLGVTMAIGQLSEPVVWRRGQSPLVRAIALTNVALGARLATMN